MALLYHCCNRENFILCLFVSQSFLFQSQYDGSLSVWIVILSLEFDLGRKSISLIACPLCHCSGCPSSYLFDGLSVIIQGDPKKTVISGIFNISCHFFG